MDFLNRSSLYTVVAFALVIIAAERSANDGKFMPSEAEDADAFFQIDVGVSRVGGNVKEGFDIDGARGNPSEHRPLHAEQTQNTSRQEFAFASKPLSFISRAAVDRLGRYLAMDAHRTAVDVDMVAVGVVILVVVVIFIFFTGALATFYIKRDRPEVPSGGRSREEEVALSGRRGRTSGSFGLGASSYLKSFSGFFGGDDWEYNRRSRSRKSEGVSSWSFFDTAAGGPSMSRESAESNFEAPLCPELVVQQTKGMTLGIAGAIQNSRQNDMIYVHKCDDKGDLHQMLVEIKMAEHGENCGIYLESSFGFPIAFLNTKYASDSDKKRSAEARKVTIYKSAGDSWDVSEATVFAVVQPVSTTQIDVKKIMSDGRGRQLMLRLVYEENRRSATVLDINGTFVARVRFPDSAEVQTTYITMDFGADAGLLLSAVIASSKLIHK